jgi:hypothetical protein
MLRVQIPSPRPCRGVAQRKCVSNNFASRTRADDSFRRVSFTCFIHDAMPCTLTTVAYKRVLQNPHWLLTSFPKGMLHFATETCAGHDLSGRLDSALRVSSPGKHTFTWDQEVAGSSPVVPLGRSSVVERLILNRFTNLHMRRFRHMPSVDIILARIQPCPAPSQRLRTNLG